MHVQRANYQLPLLHHLFAYLMNLLFNNFTGIDNMRTSINKITLIYNITDNYLFKHTFKIVSKLLQLSA